MYSLHLSCRVGDLDDLSFTLWEAGTVGICEQEDSLVAGFEDEVDREYLSMLFALHHPRWIHEAEEDWVGLNQKSWPARMVGQRLFLATHWDRAETPPNRIRIIHNPGMASGTGEHPCTQLALESLERCVDPNNTVVDVGTGSGILALAALGLSAQSAIGVDIDGDSVLAAKQNFELNQRRLTLAVGTLGCLASEIADVIVANLNASVLLSIADDLIRVAKPNGQIILTGFPESELSRVRNTFGAGVVDALDEWRCLTLRL